MPEISQQDIDNIVAILQRDEVPVTQFSVEDPDPLVIEGKMDYILQEIKDGKLDATDVFVNNIYQKRIDFTSDPQEQLTNHAEAIGANVDGIARVEQQKQDKLSQVDLDNIAALNQLPDKLNAKTEIVKLWGGSSQTVTLDSSYKDYNFLLIKVNLFRTTVTLNIKAPSSSNNGIMSLVTGIRYLYGVNIENNVDTNTIYITDIGFFKDNVWNDRLGNSQFFIGDIYGIKGVR